MCCFVWRGARRRLPTTRRRVFGAGCGWLPARALSDFFLDRKRRQSAGIGGDHVLTAIETVQARDELMEHLDQEFIEAMVSQACKIVRGRVHRKPGKHSC